MYLRVFIPKASLNLTYFYFINLSERPFRHFFEYTKPLYVIVNNFLNKASVVEKLKIK